MQGPILNGLITISSMTFSICHSHNFIAYVEPPLNIKLLSLEQSVYSQTFKKKIIFSVFWGTNRNIQHLFLRLRVANVVGQETTVLGLQKSVV